MKKRNKSWRWLVGIALLFLMAFPSGVAAQGEADPAPAVRPLQPSGDGEVGFEWLSPSTTGVLFTNRIAVDRYITNQIYLNGAGLALGDVDGDDRTDLFVCGVDNPNALYRNLGDWRFQEITREAKVALPGIAATGAVLADVDGDGDLDLLVNSVGQGTHILLNDGKAHFTPATPPEGLNPGHAGMSMSLADIDGDGDLDCYVTNYRVDSLRDLPGAQLKATTIDGKMKVISLDGRPTTQPDLVGRFELTPEGQIIENGEPDVLYLNDGQGRFTPVSWTDGRFRDEDGQPLKEPPYDWGLSVMFRDLDRDGDPDIYVCNDFQSPDRVWINNGDGGFQAIERIALRHTSIFSMGVDFGDLNRDGHDDLVVSDMMMQGHASRQLRIGDVPPVFLGIGVVDDRPQYSANTVQLNRGDDTFADVAWYGNAEASGWTWCPVLLDVDLDGYEDLIFPTGHERDMMNGDVIEQAEVLRAQRKMSQTEVLHLRKNFDRFDTPNVAFRNLGNLHFEDYSQTWGFTAKEVSQGIALGDLDNDGDLDVVVNNLNSCVGLYRNQSTADRVAVRLRGRGSNTRGIGARLTLHGGAVAHQSQEMMSGGRYLSGDEALRVFAPSRGPMELEVAWPSGRRSRVQGVLANHLYEISEPDSPPVAPPTRTLPRPVFEPVPGFAHQHVESPFDDFPRQPLLPMKLSQLGPGVAWADVNGDGWEDLVIGSGRGGSPAVRINDQKGGFSASTEPVLTRPVPRDQTGVLALGSTLLIGASNYEDGSSQGGRLRVYDLNRKGAGDSVLGDATGVGPLAMGDADLDGDLDLFIGGRVRAGQYPAPADSLLLSNDDGRFTPRQAWDTLGLVAGAVFSDLDLDGDLDLVLACDWGPIRVLQNDQGVLIDATEAWGLASFEGRWTGLTTGDLNNDGRPDIIAGNYGLNSSFRATPEHPFLLYYGDLDGDERVEVIEARFDPGIGAEVPQRGLRPVGSALPWVNEQIGSLEAYGKASLREIYGDRLNQTQRVQATTLASTLFLNQGTNFVAHPLPPEAQWTAAFGVTVGDYDGDGNDDVFLSQNFFAVPPDAWRQDAGRGLWLRGDGQGGLDPVPGQVSGVAVYGEQRGCALGDFDQDGRIDLVVTQNGAATQLYRNRTGQPGLRVRLVGPPENLLGFGVTLRLHTGDWSGPRREVHGGSGYLSQDSPVTVLGHGGRPGPYELEVRWPGAPARRVSVQAAAKEIRVDPAGRVEVIAVN